MDWNTHPSCGSARPPSGAINRLNVSKQECTLINQLLMRTYLRLRHDEDGQALIEYALILVLVSTAAFTLLSAIGAFPASVFSKVNADF